MTVAEANKAVMRLIGEDDIHHVGDILTLYYDMAQRQIATTVAPIERRVSVEANVKTELPPDLYRIKRLPTDYVREGRQVTASEDTVLTYYAYPASCDGGSFDIDPEAQNALPFYAAAQLVLADSDMRRYNSFMDSYNNILSNIAARTPSCRVVEV